ncbi:MAG TPA: 2Fe-2S iron-sulfur cluster-binding protein [Saprospiraceae bacterium]|nr:2Fe-2S iron-sulfur cluster-binding protein [Saprospiraceae bacterium]
MISIEVTDRKGKAHVIEAPVDMGLNLMEVCKAADLPVEGTCGGMALCASCHVYILSDHQMSERSHAEEDMLDQAFFVDESSRLACQVRITEDLDGLKIKLAPV